MTETAETTETTESSATTEPARAATALALLRGAPTETELEDWGPLGEATGGEMTTSGVTLWEDGSGSETGIWECTEGPSRWSLETNEFVHVLSGRMTVTEDGGSPTEIAPGDTVLFPRGWSGTWEIHERLRKLYVIF
ncbi:MAG: cupin domain-containing protein [Acidimicrobiales bacterium]